MTDSGEPKQGGQEQICPAKRALPSDCSVDPSCVSSTFHPKYQATYRWHVSRKPTRALLSYRPSTFLSLRSRSSPETRRSKSEPRRADRMEMSDGRRILDDSVEQLKASNC